MDKVEVFNTLTERYEEWFKTHEPVWWSELEAFKRLLPVYLLISESVSVVQRCGHSP